MHELTASSDKTLKKLGQAYEVYRSKYRALINQKTGGNELSNINKNLDELDKKRQLLKRKMQEHQTDDSQELKILENKIKELRKQRDALIDEALRRYFANDWGNIEKAKDSFIRSLSFSKSPFLAKYFDSLYAHHIFA